MRNNKFSGIIIPTTSDILDAVSKLGVCGTNDGAVLIWSHGIEEDADEDLTKNLVARHPDLFSSFDGNLKYVDDEDTMLYFIS